jgi:hypothetical protein
MKRFIAGLLKNNNVILPEGKRCQRIATTLILSISEGPFTG